MARMTWSSEDMRNKAVQLKELSQSYDTIRTQLKQTATSLGSAYQSQDNLVFVTRISHLCDDLQNMSDKLRTAASTLQAQAQEYDNREKTNARAASAL